MWRLSGALLLALSIGPGSMVAGAAPAGAKWKATVVSVHKHVDGIAPGQVEVTDATCPEGYDVFSGSYAIGGESVFAHAAGAAPFLSQNLYRVTVVNPPINPFGFVRAKDASVTVAAICAASGTPVVVNGAFGKGSSNSIIPTGGLPTNVQSLVASGNVPNGAVKKIDSECRSIKDSVFSGGYTVAGSLWADAAISAVLSKVGAFSATVVNPPTNPSLGVFRGDASVRVAAICARSGRPIVLGPGVSAASLAHAAAKPKRRKPKTPPLPKGHLRATVVLKRTTVGGIKAGELQSADVKCPAGTTVFGGSYIIGGNSVLAHATVAAVFPKSNRYGVTVVNPPVNINAGIPKSTASVTVAANCARNSTPIVVDGPFTSK
jgi:hypothetical protein